MPKYLSGRVKRTPQDKLTDDRYQYLDLSQAEPNIGDPPTASGTPGIPAGQQYQLVSVLSNPGERYWIPIGGGLIPGAISVYEEGSLVGGVSSITQLNFVGNSLTAVAAAYVEGVSAGNIATITAAPPGADTSVLFKESGDFATSTDLVFNSAVGILTVGNGINIGIGGTIITAKTSSSTGSPLVGINEANPTQELDVNGDIRIRGTIYDGNNDGGTQGELLTKGLTGLEWTNASAVRSGAGGEIGQVQYHNTAGLVDGADLFYWDAVNDRVAIGHDNPTKLLDVLGASTFSGGVTVDNLYITGITTALNLINANGGVKANTLQVTDLTEDRVVYVGLNGELVDSPNLTFDDSTFGTSGINVVGTTTSGQLRVTGVSTLGNLIIDTNEIRTSTGNLTLDAYSDTVQVNSAIYLNYATQSYSKDTGALIVEGGVGIEKNLNVGNGLSVNGVTKANGVGVTLSSAGGITTTGGDLYVGGDLFVKESTILSAGIFEHLLVTGISTFKGDLELWGNGSSSKDAFWDKGNTQFVFNNDVNLKFGTLQDFSVYFDNTNKCGTLKITNNTANDGIIKILGPTNALVTEFNALGSVDLYYNGTTDPGLKFQTSGIGVTVYGQLDANTASLTGDLTVGGVSNLNGNVNLGDATTDNIDFKGKVDSDIIPNIPNQNNLGSAGNRWDVVYANTFDGLGTLTVDDLYVAGIATFKDDVEFHGTGGVDSKGNVGIKSAFWDKSEMKFRYLDNIEASWGDSEDLEIYHFDHSFIKNSSITGNLYVDSTNEFYIRTEDGAENAIKAKTNEGVDLYYNGGLRLSTHDIGISLKSGGTVGAGISLYNSANNKYAAIRSPGDLVIDYTLTLPRNTGQDGELLQTDGTGVLSWGPSSNLNVESADKVSVGSTNLNDTYHFAFVKDNNPYTNRQNEHLYSDANITYKFNETTSIGNFGINVASPDALLDLYHAKDTDNWRFRINTDVSNGAGFYQKADGNFEMVLYDKTNKNNYILGDGGSLAFITNADANTEGTEKFRMGPNGQLGIAGANYGTAGYVLKSQGPNDPVVWALDSSGGTTPGGDDTQVQYNNDGSFGGMSNLTYIDSGTDSGNINILGSDNAIKVQWKAIDNVVADGPGVIEFKDDVRLRFGTSTPNIEIYHQQSGNQNFIDNSQKLTLKIKDELNIQTTSGENVIKAIQDGAVTLYHNSFSKLATTTDGIKIYGGIKDKTNSLGGDAQVLSSTGTELLWVNAGSVGGQPGGIDRQIQYNNNGSFGGASTFIFDDDGTYYHGVNNSIYFVGSDIHKNVSWQSNNNAFVFMNDTKINLGSEGNTNNNWQSQIYHDGNASYWSAEQGGKDINIQGSNNNNSNQTFRIRPNKNKDSIVAKANAQVSLHHNGTERLKTESSGIYITGNLNVIGGLVDTTGSLGNNTQVLSSTGGRFKWVNAGSINVEAGGDDTEIQFNNSGSLDGADYFTYVHSGLSEGDIIFHGSGSPEGTVDNVYWDRSANSFTINNSAYLQIGTINSNDWATRIYSDSAGGAIWTAQEGGGSISIIGKNATTSHYIRLKPNTSKESIVATANAEVSLWHDGTKRIETTNDGIKIHGGIRDKDGELGTPGQVLSSTSAGLDWVDQSGGGGGTPDTPLNSFQFNEGGSFGGADHFEYDSSTGGVKFTDGNTSADTNKHLRIYTNNRNYIDASGASLEIRLPSDTANSAIRLKPGSSHSGLNVNYQGSVEAYYNNSKKIETQDGGISIYGTNSLGAGIVFYESSANGSNKINIKSPNSLVSDYTLTLPIDDGDPNEVLTTDGAGVLSWTSKGGGDGVTYKLPLTGTNATGTVGGSATWTLLASDGTNYPNMHVEAIAGNNVYISAIDPSEPAVSFTINAINTKYDYLLKDHGSSTGAGSGNDVKLRLSEDGASPAVDKDIRLIAGNNVTFVNDETNKTLVISSAGSGGGATTFLGLTDVDPATYSGQAGKFVKVNSTPDGLEFGDQTTYDISCADGDVSTEEKIVLTSTNPSATDHITLAVAGTGLAISRDGDKITFTGSGGGSGGDTTYTLPLSGSNGSNFGEGHAIWTLTDDASPITYNPIKIIAGSNIKIDNVETAGSTPSFTINAAGAADDSYTLPVTSSGNNIKLTLTPASGNDPLDSQIVTIEKGNNITLTKTTGNNFKIDVDTTGITGTTYQLKATKTNTGSNPNGTADTNPYLFLDASSGTDDSVRIVGAGNVTVTRINDGQITINGTGSGTGTTYTYNVSPLWTNNPRLRLTNDTDNSDTQDIEIAGDSMSGISVVRTSDKKITISASSGIGAAYKLVGEVSVGQNFNAGSGTFKLARNNVVDESNTIKVSAGKNIKITGSDTDFKIEADDIASGAFKFKNTATPGSVTAAKFQLYADGETGNSDQLITITPGGGISFVNSAQGLTIASDSTTGGATYSLASHGTDETNSGLTLSGTNRTTDDVIGIVGDEGIKVTKFGNGLKIAGGTSTGSDHFTLPLSSITDGVAITLDPKNADPNTSNQVVNIKAGSGIDFVRNGQTFTISASDTATENGNLPIGSIIAFNGATPPGSKWKVCNGQPGTPNLVGKFILGGTSVGTEGGDKYYGLGHSHNINGTFTTTAGIGNHNNHWYQRVDNFSSGGGDASNRRAPFQPVSVPTYGPPGEAPGAHAHTMDINVNTGFQREGYRIGDNLPPYYTLVYIIRVTA